MKTNKQTSQSSILPDIDKPIIIVGDIFDYVPEPSQIWDCYLDPSTTNTGIVLESEKTIVVGSLLFEKHYHKDLKEIKKHEDIKGLSTFIYKLRKIHPLMETLKAKFQIKNLILENCFINPKFLQSSMQLMELHGYLAYEFLEQHVEYFAPGVIKKAITGNGQSKKMELQKILEEKYNIHFLDDNQSDAFALLCTKKNSKKMAPNEQK